MRLLFGCDAGSLAAHRINSRQESDISHRRSYAFAHARLNPLGRAWSVDQLRGSNRKKLAGSVKPVAGFVCSVGTACLLLQVCVMYVTAGLSKWNEPWLNGVAMDYIFRQDCYARPLSGWLVQFPTFTSMVTYATLCIELVVPLLVFVPYKTVQ